MHYMLNLSSYVTLDKLSGYCLCDLDMGGYVTLRRLYVVYCLMFAQHLII